MVFQLRTSLIPTSPNDDFNCTSRTRENRYRRPPREENYRTKRWKKRKKKHTQKLDFFFFSRERFLKTL